jgi:hypothetical protein
MFLLVTSLVLLQAPDIAGPARPPPPPPPAAVAPAPPSPPSPPSPAARPALPVPPREATDVLRGEWPAQPSTKRVTLKGKETIDDAAVLIAKEAGWNIATNTGRLGDRMLLLQLNDVPVEEALRVVLTGSGLVATRRGNVVAVAPDLGPPAPELPALPTLTGFEKPSGKNFTGDFEDEDGRDVLLAIGRAAGLSIMVPPGTHGKVTAHFKEVPVEEALRAVLAQAGLSAVRQGSMLLVHPQSGGRGSRLGHAGSFGEIGAEIDRLTEEATRSAEREARRAERESRRAEGGSRRDHEQVGVDVTIEPGETARDVTAVRGSVTLRPGAEAREVVAVLGSVNLEAGSSARQAVAIGGDVHVGPGASVEQDAVSIGGRVLVDPAGDVAGKKVSIGVPGLSQLLSTGKWVSEGGEERSALWSLAGFLAKLGVCLLLGLLLLTLFPARVEAVGAAMMANPGKALLAGFLSILAQPLLSLLLVVTLVGIPLLAVQVLGLLVGWLLGVTALAITIGRRLPEVLHRGSPVLKLALGLVLMLVAFAIPVVGWAVWSVVVMMSLGAVVLTRFGQTPILPTTPAPPSFSQPFAPQPPAPPAV